MPSFGLDVQRFARSGCVDRAGRQPHEGREDLRVGLLGRERAVAVAVEARRGGP